MRVLVCGGREFDDLQLFMETMDDFSTKEDWDNKQPITIIEGGAKGADFLARCWAKYCGWGHAPYPADWKKYGKRAGQIRNQQMLDEGKPDLVIAFPGGAGTADMVRRAKVAGTRVIEVEQ